MISRRAFTPKIQAPLLVSPNQRKSAMEMGQLH